MARRLFRWALKLTAVVLVTVAALGVAVYAVSSRFDPHDWPEFVTWTREWHTVSRVEAHQDLRWADLRRADPQAFGHLLPTLGFNLRTRWPALDRFPPNANPGQLLTNAMNPGLGVRELHRQHLTGRGVHVAIIDFNVLGHHPEYASNLVEVHRPDGLLPHHASMHGPAVLSLLAGRKCGTAPEARVHFFATTDPGSDSAEYAGALEAVIDYNRSAPPADRIRVVSISSAPSGPALYPVKNGPIYEAAFARAEAADILVIDGTVPHGFVGPCSLDPAYPEDPARCRPVPARGRPDYFAGRVLCPTSPRTTAEEYSARQCGYQYCGLQRETHQAAGSSWSMPYAAGVAALAWQLRPELTASAMRELMRDTAQILSSGERVINPPALIARIRNLPDSAPSTPEPVATTSPSSTFSSPTTRARP